MAQRRLPSLNALRAFEAAARLSSFTEAAAELGVTQGAISRQIKLLEEQLQADLFHRTAQGVTSTPAGRDLLPVLSDCFDRIERATAALAEDPRQIALSALSSFGLRWVMPRLPRFHAAFRTFQVRLTTIWEPSETIEGVDAGIICSRRPPPHLKSIHLTSELLVPVASPKLIDSGPRLDEPGDLDRHTLLHTSLDRRDWRIWLVAAGCADLQPISEQFFLTTDTALRVAEQGLGITVGDRPLIEDDLALGRLVAPFALEVPSGFHYWLACREEDAHKPKLRALFRFFESEAGLKRRD